MDGYVIHNVRTLVQQLGEDSVKELLSEFSCPMNLDVEQFARAKAIEFAKQGLAATHLVYAPYKGTPVLVGYFALASKVMRVITKKLPSKWRQRVNRFSYEKISGAAVIPATLLGQFSKNFTCGYDKLIAFYRSHGFMAFDERPIEPDETDAYKGHSLIQMIRYME